MRVALSLHPPTTTIIATTTTTTTTTITTTTTVTTITTVDLIATAFDTVVVKFEKDSAVQIEAHRTNALVVVVVVGRGDSTSFLNVPHTRHIVTPTSQGMHRRLAPRTHVLQPNRPSGIQLVQACARQIAHRN